MKRWEVLSWVFSILGAVVFFIYSVLDVPYRDVNVLDISYQGDAIIFSAEFTKTSCEFNRLVIVHSSAGVPIFTSWEGLDGLARDHDRIKGTQSLNLSITLPDIPFDWIEIRTRHLCDGDRVDKVFARFTYSDIDGWPVVH